jgi:hypothetical protein
MLKGNMTMKAQKNRRTEDRFENETAVLIENHQNGKFYEGKMLNYSTCGVCVCTDFEPQSGTDIFIGIEKSPYSNSHDIFRAKIVWCTPLSEKKAANCFRIGAKYY